MDQTPENDEVTLLLIEDDDADAALLAESVSRISGRMFRIERGETLAEGRAILQSTEVGAILLDLSLPDASGVEALENLVEAKVDRPIIVLTGIDDEVLGRDLIRLGAQDYVPKSELVGGAIRRSISHSIERHEMARALLAAESQALEASSAKSDFVASVSHEIRTPMHAILGIADLLGETPLDEEQRNYVRTFQRSGNTLLALINNVLDLSRIESGGLTFSIQEFDPVELLEATVETFSFAAKEKNVRMATSVSNRVPPRCLADVDRIRQVLANLIGNAVKFTESGEIIGTFDINGAGRLSCVIEDTGCGVESEDYESLFEPFSQGAAGVHRHHGGTGLGLAISRALVEMMGGRISASARPGGGSRFEFDVSVEWEGKEHAPVSTETASEIASALSSAPPSPEVEEVAAPTPQRLLLVDDSADNRMLAQAYLSGCDFEIDVAENGAEAIRSFSESSPYALILMDMQMPVVDGYEATREIRRLEACGGLARTPIVALTADAFAEQKAEAERAGCDEHLTKPINRAILVEAVEKWAVSEPEPANAPEVDPIIADLIPGFVARRLEDLELLEAALTETRFEDVRRIAHKLKGSGLSFGFPKLSALGGELEQAAIAQDEKAVSSGIDLIRKELVPYGAEDLD